MPLPDIIHLMHGLAVTGQASCGSNGTCNTGLPKVGAGTSELQAILSIVFGVLAAVSVLMIVISGLRFITAQGNPQDISKARSTIIYSVVGLFVALIAEAIVALVLGKVNP